MEIQTDVYPIELELLNHLIKQLWIFWKTKKLASQRMYSTI